MDITLPLSSLKGVGPKTTAALSAAGLYTLHDLIYYFPRTYENYQSTTSISQIRPGKIMIKGYPQNLRTTRARRRNISITEGIISEDVITDGATRGDVDSIRVVWFNQPYRARQLDQRKQYYFAGNYELKYGKYQLTAPVVTPVEEVSSATSAFQPIYPAKNGLKPAFFQKLLAQLRPSFATIPDLIPQTSAPAFIRPGARADSLYKIHFPSNPKEVTQAKKYLSYEELFEYLLAADLNKQTNQKLHSIPLPFNAQNTKELVSHLPFKLTAAQRIATWDILRDLEKPIPMNRLLQGDVGSGKTVVAAIAAHQSAKNGHQTAILAPTAILASQHAQGLSALLEPFGLRVALLTGATKQKSSLKQQIKNGEIDIIIGTHALLTDDTIFHSLALCIIDEQHRFGVAQRQKLLEKTALTAPGQAPHLLSMTATPIPRSLQLTIFGDLDISVLDSLPQGRQPIHTQILTEIAQKEHLYPIIHQKLAAKEQIYWICKLIDDPASTPVSASAATRRTSSSTSVSTSDKTTVIQQAKKLSQLFPEATIAFLHGKMKPAQKDQIMADFLAGNIDILVSTTVVEVGVNVPNATQIVIMDAESYGLAQLHQLRGRVGRGTKASACYLITSGEKPPSRRLRELEKSTDGFYLAEIDLKLRGPGEIYGGLQHGELNLQMASFTDTKLISLARRQVADFAQQICKNPEIMLKYKELNQEIKKYQQLTTLN